MDNGFWLYNLFFDYTLRTVALGSAAIGIVSGALGAFAVLRRQSLLGDAISHAALPGVTLAFLLTRSKAPLLLVTGALITGWLATVWMNQIIKKTRIKEDSALGLVLSVFFGLGMVLLTFTQRLPDASQAGLDRFLFGQAAALLASDLQVMGLLGGLALALLLLFWKEFKLLSFDRDYAATQGYPVGLLDLLLTSLLVVAIVIGLQAVGVVLMSAMVVAPAAAARQWTDRLGGMVALSALFGALAGVAGTLISSTARGLSTGPTIVLCASALVLISLLLAPNRGLAAAWLRQQKSRRQIKLDAVLGEMYHLAEQHNDPLHPHSTEVVGLAARGKRQGLTALNTLAARGLVRQVNDGWVLTESGVKEAEKTARRSERSQP